MNTNNINLNNNNWIYFGVFLDEDSRDNIKDYLERFYPDVIHPDWRFICHHMTIAFNDGSELSKSIHDEYIGKMGTKVSLLIDSLGVSDKAVALGVKFKGKSANKINHVTVFVSPNGKPVDSNYITNWKNILGFNIEGEIHEFTKRK